MIQLGRCRPLATLSQQLQQQHQASQRPAASSFVSYRRWSSSNSRPATPHDEAGPSPHLGARAASSRAATGSYSSDGPAKSPRNLLDLKRETLPHLGRPSRPGGQRSSDRRSRSSFKSSGGSSQPIVIPPDAPELIKTTMPHPTGEKVFIMQTTDLVRLAQGYKKLRPIRDFDKLVAKFLQQRRFEIEQKMTSPTSGRQKLQGMSGSEVKQTLSDLSGLRGVPVLQHCLPESWGKPKRPREAILAVQRPPLPKCYGPEQGAWGDQRKAIRGLRPRLPRTPDPPRPDIPLTVRCTAHHGAQGGKPSDVVVVPSPPMTADLHPGLPPTFLPPAAALLKLDRPLLQLRGIHRARGGSACKEANRDPALALRRQYETSPEYVRQVRALLEGESDARLSKLADWMLRKAAEKLEPLRAVERRSDVRQDNNVLEVDYVPPGNEVLSIGLFIPISIKRTHAVKCVREKIRRKTKVALVDALKRDFAERGATPEALERWQHYVFYIDPSPMVKLLPSERLADIMYDALQKLHEQKRRSSSSSSTRHSARAPVARSTTTTAPARVPPKLSAEQRLEREAGNRGMPVEELWALKERERVAKRLRGEERRRAHAVEAEGRDDRQRPP